LFHEIANKIYHFVWHSYCDWYIEIIKQNFDNEKYADEIKKVSGWTFIQVLKIIHPIMPFISEKLWRTLVDSKSYLISQVYQNYTTNNSFNISKKNFEIFIEFVTSIRNLRSELNIPYKQLINISLETKNTDLSNFLYEHKNEISNFLKTKHLNFEKIKPNKNSALIVLRSLSVLIPLEGIVNSVEELKKLNKKKQIEQEKFNKVNDKLNNHNFMNKASEEIIDKFKNEANIYKSSIEKIEQIINTIK